MSVDNGTSVPGDVYRNLVCSRYELNVGPYPPRGDWEPPLNRTATWLILPVVICLSQRLSHACLSTSLTDSYLFGATPYRLVFVSRDDLILIYWTRRLLALHLTDSYSYLEMISALQTSIRISNTVIFVWRIIGPAGHQTYRALVIGPAGQQTYRAIAILSYLFGATPYGLVWRYRLRTCIRILR